MSGKPAAGIMSLACSDRSSCFGINAAGAGRQPASWYLQPHVHSPHLGGVGATQPVARAWAGGNVWVAHYDSSIVMRDDVAHRPASYQRLAAGGMASNGTVVHARVHRHAEPVTGSLPVSSRAGCPVNLGGRSGRSASPASPAGRVRPSPPANPTAGRPRPLLRHPGHSSSLTSAGARGARSMDCPGVQGQESRRGKRRKHAGPLALWFLVSRCKKLLDFPLLLQHRA